jgi:hypothetical protein
MVRIYGGSGKDHYINKNGKVKIYPDNHYILTWYQDRCVACGRYLGLHGRKYCSKCRRKQTYKVRQEWIIKNREYIRKKDTEYKKEYRKRNKEKKE